MNLQPTIVVCRCLEQPKWIEPLSSVLPIVVIDKGATNLERPGKAHVIKRPNSGRESSAWLWYLQDCYDSHAEHTVFLQADPVPHWGLNLWDMVYMPISNQFCECNDKGEPSHGGLPIREVWEKVWPGRAVPDKLHFYAGGQFMVHRDLILAYPRSFYENGLNVCEQVPNAAWVFERLWHTLWTDKP